MSTDKEIIGGANHGKGTLILHRWKRYDIGAPGSLHHSSGYQSACGRAVTSGVLDLGDDAGRCGVCFKRSNDELSRPATAGHELQRDREAGSA